jgi:hypothetical protein
MARAMKNIRQINALTPNKRANSRVDARAL